MNKPLTFLLSLTVLFLFSGSVCGGDLQVGWNAYKNNDYKKAYKLWLPLAEQGNVTAQYNFGHMYEK
jgi:TPR repeat protein